MLFNPSQAPPLQALDSLNDSCILLMLKPIARGEWCSERASNIHRRYNVHDPPNSFWAQSHYCEIPSNIAGRPIT